MILRVYESEDSIEQPLCFKLAQDGTDINILARKGSGAWCIVAWFNSDGELSRMPLTDSASSKLGLPTDQNDLVVSCD